MTTTAVPQLDVESWLREGLNALVLTRETNAFVVQCRCGRAMQVDASTGDSRCDFCDQRGALDPRKRTEVALGVDPVEASRIVQRFGVQAQPQQHKRQRAPAPAQTNGQPNGSNSGKPRQPAKSATEGIPRFQEPRELMDRKPPSNVRLEMGLLACILVDPYKLAEVATLKPDDFYDPNCRAVYEAMLQLSAEGKLVDAELLHDRLVASLTLDGGAADFLVKIAEVEATSHNAVHYASEISKKATQRRVQVTGARLYQLGADDLGASLHHDRWLAEVREVASGVTRHPSLEQSSITYDWLDFPGLENCATEQKYLVEDVVTEAQGGVMGGRFKTLKTTVGGDLSVSMATGRPFLDHFHVPEPIPCGIMTAESGTSTVRETLRRIAAAKGIGSSELNDRLFISTKLPALGSDDHLEAIERDIRKYGLRCLMIDPSYLAFSEVGDSASNVFKMGAVLAKVTKIIQATNCSIILLNHTTKGRGKDIGKNDPPELGEVAMSGFAEWARFWILLAARLEWDEQTGRHWLWMRTGGSAGHADLWSLDVTEGRRSDPEGRKWEVEVSTAADAVRQRHQQAENNKAAQQERTEAEHQRKLLAALLAFPAGETGRVLREAAGLSGGNFATAIRALLSCGKAEKIDIHKQGKIHDGYRPKN